MSKYLPWIALLFVSAIWGLAFPAIKFLLGFVTPYELLVVRFVPTSILTVICIIMCYRRVLAESVPRYKWVFLALSGAWVYLYHLFLNIGETVLSASVAGLIIATYPVFTVIFAGMLKTERLTASKLVGCIIALAGTVVLTTLGAHEETLRTNISPLRWVLYSLITLVAPVTAAFTTLITKKFMVGNEDDKEGIRSDVMTLGYMAPSGLFSLPYLNRNLVTKIGSFPLEFWLALIVLVLFCTIIAHFIWFWALKKIEAGPVAISTYIIPVFSIFYSWVWLNEVITLSTIIGALAILSGVLISGIDTRNHR